MSRNWPDWIEVGYQREDIEDREGREMCYRSCEWFSVAEGLQVQEMRLEE